MDLTPHIEQLRRELAAVGEIGGDDTRAPAERLATPLESAARLTLLDALSAASDAITRDLAPGSVHMRLRGLDPEFVVTAPPPPMAPSVAPMTPRVADGEEAGGTARINFRLPAPLKARVEDAAAQEALSVNAWLVRAAAIALEPNGPAEPAAAAA
ncbi:hypothetical protein ACFZCG_13520 [Streptomyces tanashiensis]|uniref:hypothetical protein n=1 Tax=Streptomyces tanashiensis TaxID=67367 RepID=UPI0036F13BDF